MGRDIHEGSGDVNDLGGGVSGSSGLSEADVEALLGKAIGTTVMSQTDAGVEFLKTLGIQIVYYGEEANTARPEAAHVIWVGKEGIAPNHATKFAAGVVTDIVWYLSELPV